MIPTVDSLDPSGMSKHNGLAFRFRVEGLGKSNAKTEIFPDIQVGMYNICTYIYIW